jgi:hypothetical protein
MWQTVMQAQSDTNDLNGIADFIWGIAVDALRDLIARGDTPGGKA